MSKTKKGSLHKNSRIIIRGGYWVYRKIKSFFVSIYWLPYYLYNKFKHQQQAVFCECLMGYDGYHLKKNNWGDDINLFFFELITDKRFIFIPFEQTLLKVPWYSFKVPSCWVEFTKHADYWSFKYLDFYESIGNVNNNSVKLYLEDRETARTVREHLSGWRPSSINYRELLSFFPFELSKKRQLGN